MPRKFLFVLFCSLIGFNLACQATNAPGANSNTANTAATNANQNLPEGLSTSPVPMTGTTPGIPDTNSVNMNSVPKGATPTPGIPDAANLNKPFKPGATPTPGIPDQDTLRKQMKQPPLGNKNAPKPNSNAASTNTNSPTI